MKKVIIPVLILFSLVLGGCLNKDGAGVSLGGNKPKGEPFKGNIAAAAKLGVPYKCKMSVDGETESVGYVKGKSYRGKTQEARTGEIVELLMKDNCTWMWSEDSSDPGVKICYEGDEAKMMWGEVDEEDLDLPEGFEAPDTQLDCNPAIIPPGTFNLPSGKEFNDMTEMMNMFAPTEEGEYPTMSEEDVQKMMEQYGQ